MLGIEALVNRGSEGEPVSVSVSVTATRCAVLCCAVLCCGCARAAIDEQTSPPKMVHFLEPRLIRIHECTNALAQRH
jgi:hypothetical protein